MVGLAIAILVLAFGAGICKGICDTISFHWETSFAKRWGWNEEWWNPSKGWQLKYAKDNQGNLVRPLEPAFLGSTTFLVFTTDAWHFFQFLLYAQLRLALVILIHMGLILNPEWWTWLATYVILWGVQAGGFHLIYTVLDRD